MGRRRGRRRRSCGRRSSSSRDTECAKTCRCRKCDERFCDIKGLVIAHHQKLKKLKCHIKNLRVAVKKLENMLLGCRIADFDEQWVQD